MVPMFDVLVSSPIEMRCWWHLSTREVGNCEIACCRKISFTNDHSKGGSRRKFVSVSTKKLVRGVIGSKRNLLGFA